MKNIILVSFQGITKAGAPEGMVKLMMPLAKHFKNEKEFTTHYYVRDKGSVKLGFIRSLSKKFLIFYKLISLIDIKIINLPSYLKRLSFERYFDFLFTSKVRKKSVIISSAYLHHSLKRNKKRGGKNIFIAGNPCDIEIYHLMKKELKIIRQNYIDAYTYLPRIEFIKKSLHNYDHICCLSESVYTSYEKHFPNKKLSLCEYHILPRIDIFSYQPKIIENDTLIFSFISNPFLLKGLHYLIEAWSKADLKNCKLIIGGRLDSSMKKVLSKNYSNIDNVEYIGWVRNLNDFYKYSHVFISPSLIDAGPTTVTEAMYCGNPVIITNSCGSSSIVKNFDNGFVVDPGNSDQIADKLIWFNKNRKELQTMSQNAHNQIEMLFKKDQNLNLLYHLKGLFK